MNQTRREFLGVASLLTATTVAGLSHAAPRKMALVSSSLILIDPSFGPKAASHFDDWNQAESFLLKTDLDTQWNEQLSPKLADRSVTFSGVTNERDWFLLKHLTQRFWYAPVLESPLRNSDSRSYVLWSLEPATT